MTFESLELNPVLLRSLEDAGYQNPTPIQAKAIPIALTGRDLVGCAQTGTGKTAAFSLPTLHRLMESNQAPTGAARRRQRSGRRPIRCLVLSPTRELAGQIGECLDLYGQRTNLRHAVIFGGVGQSPQVKKLQAGIDVLVATPGRLLDLIGQRHVDLSEVEILILDEADQMLDMGFIHDLRKIVRLVPTQRQTLMFSATMPPEVRKLADQWLHRPSEIKVNPVASTPQRVDQTVYFVEKRLKGAMLTRFLQDTARTKTLVFSRTKRGADRLARILNREGIQAVALHGDKSQSTRQSVMRAFQSTQPPVLIATDLAARGLDFSEVSHVINYDLPSTAETYVHRIGRTARAGTSGIAVSFCDQEEKPQLRAIEKLTGKRVPVCETPKLAAPTANAQASKSNPRSPSTKSTSTRNTTRRPKPSKTTTTKHSSTGNRSTGNKSTGNKTAANKSQSRKPTTAKPAQATVTESRQPRGPKSNRRRNGSETGSAKSPRRTANHSQRSHSRDEDDAGNWWEDRRPAAARGKTKPKAKTTRNKSRTPAGPKAAAKPATTTAKTTRKRRFNRKRKTTASGT